MRNGLGPPTPVSARPSCPPAPWLPRPTTSVGIIPTGRRGRVEVMNDTPAFRLDRAPRAQQRRIATALSRIGLALPGSVEARQTRCGKPHCPCKADPPQLHGPYIVRTPTPNAKTVTRVLTPDQLQDYQ